MSGDLGPSHRASRDLSDGDHERYGELHEKELVVSVAGNLRRSPPLREALVFGLGPLSFQGPNMRFNICPGPSLINGKKIK